MKWLLQIEAINIDAVINETGQLSVRRGASMAMREATKQCSNSIPADNALNRIRHGGSVALYQFEADNTTAEQIRQTVIDYLNGRTITRRTKPSMLKYLLGILRFRSKSSTLASAKTRHASKLNTAIQQISFSVAIVEQQSDPGLEQQILLAKNRFNQMKGTNVALLDLKSREQGRIPDNKPACYLEGRKPASVEFNPNENAAGNQDNVFISNSINDLLKYGREQKHRFIANELGEQQQNRMYTNDFEQLTEWSIKASQERFACRNKMAVLYFDGNHFGKKQNDLTYTELTAFDNLLAKKRQTFLNNIIQELDQDDLKHSDSNDDKRIRLEILMWGGDEVLLAVPAWAGFAVLHRFYQTMQGLHIRDEELSHAGGIVFCSHKTPIQKVSRLATELAEYSKRFSRKENLYFPMLLESEDYPTQHVSKHWEQHYGEFGSHLLPLKPLGKESMGKLADFQQLHSADIHSVFRRYVLSRHENYKTDAEDREARQELKKQCELLLELPYILFPRMEKNSLARDCIIDSERKNACMENYRYSERVQALVMALEYWPYIQNPFEEITQ